MMGKKDKIPSGKISRSAIVGLTTARAGLKKLESLSKKPFLSEEMKKEHDRIDNEDIAKIIFDALSKLKGTALKVAQMASMEMELIPEIYRNELYKSTSQVPPINRALIRKIITDQLGEAPEKIFGTFESTPFAAASLGQVHRAVSKSGEELAVKVQYPGIAESIKSDIDILKLLLKHTKYSSIFKFCIDEIEEKIKEELDYLNEAENTEWFLKNLAIRDIIIPRVVKSMITEKVMTSTIVHGLHLDEWLATGPSQEEKNHYGQVLADLFNRTVHELGTIHADPNPGNYIFRNDGRLGVIDFGCVKKIDDDFSKSLNQLAGAYEKNDFSGLKQINESMGLYFKSDAGNAEFRKFFSGWLEWITRPYRMECFPFSKNSGYFKEGMVHLKFFYKYINHFKGSFTYYGRSLYGLYRILHRLEADVKLKPEYHKS